MFLINMYTAPLVVLAFKPDFRQTFCKWQTLTSYLTWTMIESMEQSTLKKHSIIPVKIEVYRLVANALAWFRCHLNDRKKQVTC